MKLSKHKLLALTAVLLLAPAQHVAAQYYQLANQVSDMLQTALTAGARYRGMVDVSYLQGFGSKRANIVEITTTQGVQFSPLFYAGVGLGLDVLMTETNDGWQSPPPNFMNGHGYTTTGFAIPLYSQFRLDFGANPGFFADLRLGASFLVGDDYVRVADGVITNSEFFYLRPTIGMRIPLSNSNPKLAVNIGIFYQLLTSTYWYVSYNSQTLNSAGINIGIQW